MFPSDLTAGLIWGTIAVCFGAMAKVCLIVIDGWGISNESRGMYAGIRLKIPAVAFKSSPAEGGVSHLSGR